MREEEEQKETIHSAKKSGFINLMVGVGVYVGIWVYGWAAAAVVVKQVRHNPAVPYYCYYATTTTTHPIHH